MRGLIGQGLMLTGGLVALYLALAYATGGGQLLREAGSAYQGGVRVLQGR